MGGFYKRTQGVTHILTCTPCVAAKSDKKGIFFHDKVEYQGIPYRVSKRKTKDFILLELLI